MDDLKQSIITRLRYNKMPTEEFMDLVEKYIGKEIPQKEKEDFEYTGLINTDFFLMHVNFDLDKKNDNVDENKR